MDPADIPLCGEYEAGGACRGGDDCPLIHGDKCEVRPGGGMSGGRGLARAHSGGEARGARAGCGPSGRAPKSSPCLARPPVTSPLFLSPPAPGVRAVCHSPLQPGADRGPQKEVRRRRRRGPRRRGRQGGRGRRRRRRGRARRGARRGQAGRLSARRRLRTQRSPRCRPAPSPLCTPPPPGPRPPVFLPTGRTPLWHRDAAARNPAPPRDAYQGTPPWRRPPAARRIAPQPPAQGWACLFQRGRAPPRRAAGALCRLYTSPLCTAPGCPARAGGWGLLRSPSTRRAPPRPSVPACTALHDNPATPPEAPPLPLQLPALPPARPNTPPVPAAPHPM
jgi:hypothetical protein